MFDPAHWSKEVIHPSSRLGDPGILRARSAKQDVFGFFVPIKTFVSDSIIYPFEQSDAFIRLFVCDRTSPYSGFIPFIIDTGSQITILPRKLTHAYAFPTGRAGHPYYVPVEGAAGGILVGRVHSLYLSIIPPNHGWKCLPLGSVETLLVDTWSDDYAILGLDALRRCVMLSDGRYISFWPRDDDASPP